ncbi:MAG: hypothetical protein L0228_04095 [Planctomycetes bacterium]|nr:hypothetical protein [Planctomycetota bacterium]
MRTVIVRLSIATMIHASASGISLAGELAYGYMTSPACGKVCKLVCETKKLPAVGYGYQCESICIPSPSRQGCKHCDVTCCPGDDREGCPPKIEFCWYDWFACGCAKPRTVKVLTKFQAEREVKSYHWEVVDASCCDGVSQHGTPVNDNSIYKPAPAEAQLGDVLVVSDEEWAELAPLLAPNEMAAAPLVAEQTTPAPTTPEKTSVAERLQGLFRK